MASFTVKVGKENVEVVNLVGNLMMAKYQGQEIFFEWVSSEGKIIFKQTLNKVDDKTFQKIVKAIREKARG